MMVNTTAALFKVQASRNKAAFQALLQRWAGILLSDGYGMYQHWVHGRIHGREQFIVQNHRRDASTALTIQDPRGRRWHVSCFTTPPTLIPLKEESCSRVT